MPYIVGSAGVMIDTSEHRHQRDQRDRGDVLKQQNGKRQAPVGAGQLLALGKALQAERGGRQRQTEAQHNRAVQRLTEHGQRQHANHRRGQQHLRQTDTEHRFAHHPQASRRQLKTNDEQQQHHAQLRDVRHALRVADQAQHRRADDHPGKQITNHRTQLQTFGQGHGEHRREQKNNGGLQQIAFMGHGFTPDNGTAGGRQG